MNIDLTKPLARGRNVTLMGGKYWIPIGYEKFPRVCYACVCIIHEAKKCKCLNIQNGGGNQFGAWIRAQWEGRRNSHFEQPYQGPPKPIDSKSGDVAVKDS